MRSVRGALCNAIREDLKSRGGTFGSSLEKFALDLVSWNGKILFASVPDCKEYEAAASVARRSYNGIGGETSRKACGKYLLDRVKGDRVLEAEYEAAVDVDGVAGDAGHEIVLSEAKLKTIVDAAVVAAIAASSDVTAAAVAAAAAKATESFREVVGELRAEVLTFQAEATAAKEKVAAAEEKVSGLEEEVHGLRLRLVQSEESTEERANDAFILVVELLIDVVKLHIDSRANVAVKRGVIGRSVDGITLYSSMSESDAQLFVPKALGLASAKSVVASTDFELVGDCASYHVASFCARLDAFLVKRRSLSALAFALGELLGAMSVAERKAVEAKISTWLVRMHLVQESCHFRAFVDDDERLRFEVGRPCEEAFEIFALVLGGKLGFVSTYSEKAWEALKDEALLLKAGDSTGFSDVFGNSTVTGPIYNSHAAGGSAAESGAV